jgi:Na+:H+ antiporter, NhaA family
VEDRREGRKRTDDVTTPGQGRTSFIRPLTDFLSAEASGGVVVVLAAVVAMVWANSPWKASYQALWSTDLGATFGRFRFSMDLRHWVNDGLMTIFFFVVGLEIKRELVEGELRDRRKAITPVVAAIGGMVVPALIFLAWTAGTPQARGWGIPMATDIALAVGLLTLAGPRIPPGAKLFLLTLAIVDDLGAIAVIALFYRQGGRTSLFAIAVGALVLAAGLRRFGVTSFAAYVLLGVVMWWALHEAGVHATIAGVAMGFLAPTKPFVQSELIDVDELSDLSTVEHAKASVHIARSSVSVVEWLEHLLHGWTSFVVVPIFAIANAGIPISGSGLREAAGARVAWGVATGLAIGKPLGILAATWLVVRVGAGSLPEGTTWRSLVPAAIVAGVGFTVSLFVTELAFAGPVSDQAKVGVLVASMFAGLLGLLLARLLPDSTVQAEKSSASST